MVEVILYILYAILLGVYVIAAWRLRFAYKHFRVREFVAGPALVDQQPTVTVCIPARNETHAMTECLQRLVDSNYPKLEIIVLDDLSGDNTSVLIKSFAHAGVRFIEGTALPDGWLGKNHALHTMAEDASGKYILFIDVDTQLAPDSIEQLVAYTQQENALMISVLPRREDGWRTSVLFSPLRYFWEIAFHHKEAPATASNAWMIERKTLLERWQGFTHFKDAIQPESRFSAELMQSGQYRFLMGTEMLGVSYEKKWSSQVETSIRLLFPLLGAKVPHSIVAVLDLLIVASPGLLVIGAGVAGSWIHFSIACAFYLIFAGLYESYLKKTWKRGWWAGALLWGFIVLQEAVLVVKSTVQYKQHRVTWKGRLVKAPKLT